MRVREDTDDNIIRRVRFACRIIKERAQNIQFLLPFRGNSGYANAP